MGVGRGLGVFGEGWGLFGEVYTPLTIPAFTLDPLLWKITVTISW